MTRSPLQRDLNYDVVVVGAGVIGSACAWRMARCGLNVALVDPAPGRGATWAAAGMLAPVTEVHYGEEDVLALNLAGAKRWPSFAQELQSETGTDIGYRTCGTLFVALDDDDRDALEQLFEFQRELGLEAVWTGARDARQIEPALTPAIRAATWVPGDHQVDNRLLVSALEIALAKRGVVTHRVRAGGLEWSGSSVAGVRLDDGEVLGCAQVLVCAGWRSGELGGLPDTVNVPIRPVKGQVIRLGPAPAGRSRRVMGEPGHLLRHTVRGCVQGNNVYLVPRNDGTLVVGATVEEVGCDTSVTAGAVYELLRDAHRLVPGVTELVMDEAIAELRPGSPDNGPLVGPAVTDDGTPVEGLLLATGHFRHGILLAPLTAEFVSGVLQGRPVARDFPEFAPFPPARFRSSCGLAC